MAVLWAPLLHLPLELLLGNAAKVVRLLLQVDGAIPLLLLLSHHLLLHHRVALLLLLLHHLLLLLLLLLSHHLLLHHRVALLLLLLHHLLLLLLLLHGLTLHLALLHLLGNPALGALHLLLDTSWQDRDGIGATSTTSSPVVGSLLYEGSHETWVGLEYLEDLLLLLR